MDEESEHWMTIKELKEKGATLHPEYIRQLAKSGTFTSRKGKGKGSPIEILVTPEVISRLKINADIDLRKKDLPHEDSQIKVHTESGEYVVFQDKITDIMILRPCSKLFQIRQAVLL